MKGGERWLGVSRRGVEALAIVWGLTLACVFAWRVGFALELEWMEGGMLHQAHRIQLGLSPYPAPGPDYVPFLYTPLYSVVLAGLGWVFPLGYSLGRVVSIAAWVATCVAIFAAVRGEGKPRAHAAAAVGLACAGYVFTFRWLDLARPDTLYIALTTWGLVLLRHSGPRASRAVWAGVLIALAFWTKQTAASFVIASGVGALVVAPRRLWIYAGTIAVIDGGGVLWGNAVTDGRLWMYIYELHQSHAFNDERFTTKTWGMFVHAWPWLAVLTLGLVSAGVGRVPARVRRWRAQRRRPEPAAAAQPDADEPRASAASGEPTVTADSPAQLVGHLYWALMAVAGLWVSAVGYATQWAEPNAFVPGVVLGAVALLVSMPVGGRGELVALWLVSGQLVFSWLVEPQYQPVQTHGWAGLRHSYAWQDPARTVPSGEQRAQASALRAELAASPGEVLALHRPWWSVLAGGAGHVGSMGVTDVLPEDRAAIQRAIRDDLAARRYAQVWLEGEPPRWMLRELLRGYRVEQRRHGARRVRPLSGYMSEAGMVTPYRRDQVLWVPRGPRPIPPGATVIADFESNTLDGFVADGRAFGRPQRGSPRRLPSAGPYGGDMLLTSAGTAGRLPMMGSATSPVITLPQHGRLELLVGFGGRRSAGLSVEIVEQSETRRTVALPIPAVPHALAPVRWEIEPDWVGAQIRVRLGDQAPEAALYVDDVWLVTEP